MQSPSLPNCFVAIIDPQLADKIKSDLSLQGFEISQPSYTLFQAKKKGITCTLYVSGKITVQGKQMQEFIQFYLEPEILKTFSFGYQTVNVDTTERIGVDESGKGDFFGPLCIAGLYAKDDSIKKLIEMGVKDSKKIADASILKIAEKIRKEYTYHVVRISPRKYNELYEKFGNLNLLLGWGHATVIDQLIEKTACKNVIIDKFAGEYVVENALKRKNQTLKITQKTKAEEDPVVAGASILARASFLEGLEKTGQELGIKLPKGASSQNPIIGKQILEKFGEDGLKSVCKMHFKTYQQIIS